MSESRLTETIERSRNGDHQAFRKLVKQHQAPAYALAMHFLHDTDEAQDVVQESFLRVWQHLDSFRPDHSFAAWLNRIVTHCCLDHLKAARRRHIASFNGEPGNQMENIPNPVSVGSESRNGQLLGIIYRLVARLPRRQRIVFTLRDLQDLSIEEVATVTGLSAGSVKSNLHHARRKIRQQLQPYYQRGD
jgi:RNA polymerase sigma-70 factor (ECF subfamily)